MILKNAWFFKERKKAFHDSGMPFGKKKYAGITCFL